MHGKAPKPPVVVGLNRTQDASICLLRGDELLSLQKERLTRKKHHWGRQGDLELYVRSLPELAAPPDLVVECYSSDRELQHRDAYHAELRRVWGGCEILQVSHHRAHALSAFLPSGFDEAAVMVIDAQGSRVRDFTEDWRPATPPVAEHLEVASFYAARGRELKCLHKQLWDEREDAPAGLGMFYLMLTGVLFPRQEGAEGKVMGLASYGDADSLRLPPLAVEGCEVYIPIEWFKLFYKEREAFRYSGGEDRARFARAANLAAAGQRAFEEALLAVAGWLHRETGLARLCFTGGTALNCVANGRLLREGPYREVFIPPSPHDGGTALGCALHGALQLGQEVPGWRWTRDFLGPEPAAVDVGAVAAAHPRLCVEEPADLAAALALRAEQGEVIALFQGRSESGPRALGHRSILADARRAPMCRWINDRIKGREFFRPLAPLVLEERAAEYFQVDRPLPFMQFAAPVHPGKHAVIPAVTHVDGTARIQTVGPADDPLLRSILQAFDARTGVPILINTSLNGPGDPLVETFAEALDLFLRTPIHALAVPPFVLSKREPVETCPQGEASAGQAGGVAAGPTPPAGAERKP